LRYIGRFVIGVDGHDDHRVVMALAVAALGASGLVSIDSAEAASVSYPGFLLSISRVCSTWGPAKGTAAEDVDVKVVYGLASVCFTVNHKTCAVFLATKRDS
jgi:hypothetical protein